MRKKGFSPELIVSMLRPIEVTGAHGKTVSQACKEAGISEQSYYRWRKEYGGLDIEQASVSKSSRRRTRGCAASSRISRSRSRS